MRVDRWSYGQIAAAAAVRKKGVTDRSFVTRSSPTRNSATAALRGSRCPHEVRALFTPAPQTRATALSSTSRLFEVGNSDLQPLTGGAAAVRSRRPQRSRHALYIALRRALSERLVVGVWIGL